MDYSSALLTLAHVALSVFWLNMPQNLFLLAATTSTDKFCVLLAKYGLVSVGF